MNYKSSSKQTPGDYVPWYSLVYLSKAYMYISNSFPHLNL